MFFALYPFFINRSPWSDPMQHTPCNTMQVGLPLFQGTPLWEASLWARVFCRSVAERARLPQGTAIAPQVVGLPQFQAAPLWEASLWAKVVRRSVAERARLPQGTAMQGRPLRTSGFPAELWC